MEGIGKVVRRRRGPYNFSLITRTRCGVRRKTKLSVYMCPKALVKF